MIPPYLLLAARNDDTDCLHSVDPCYSSLGAWHRCPSWQFPDAYMSMFLYVHDWYIWLKTVVFSQLVLQVRSLRVRKAMVPTPTSTSDANTRKPGPSKRPQQLPSRQWSCSELTAGYAKLKQVKTEDVDAPELLKKREALQQKLQARSVEYKHDVSIHYIGYICLVR